ncbi:MAG: CDP-glycerol glycerophosphotransferase family protein [Bifidobacteriaceae bacterium]|jgi:CDP-glycerol glycerophosphotransferase (TagB/SpsB family)|nr:CDP-glycerol glycerophosphotransferase family protein [Bifidobacteriaceae bacterium]
MDGEPVRGGPVARLRHLVTQAIRLGPVGVGRAIVRRSLFAQRWRYVYYIAAYALWRRVLRVDPWQVAFLSDSRGRVSGNLAYLRAEIVRQSPRTRVVAVLRPSGRRPRSLSQMLRLPLVLARSRVVVLDDFYPMIYQLNLRPETDLGQVWHAVGAFKRVGHSRAGLPGGPVPGSRIHRNYTWATASSEAVRPDIAESFGIDASRVHALGVPRTDPLFDEQAVASARQRVRARLGMADGTKLVLFAPTFRGHGARTAHYDLDLVDMPRLAQTLGPDWLVAVKLHPFIPPMPPLPGIADVTAERELTELLMAADVLVTDYSSAIFEAAMLRCPVVFFAPDIAEYTASRDFYRPFERYLIGPLVTEPASLAAAIEQAHVDDAVLAPFLAEFTSACDGHSAARIAAQLVLAGAPEGGVQGEAAGEVPGGAVGEVPGGAPDGAVGEAQGDTQGGAGGEPGGREAE